MKTKITFSRDLSRYIREVHKGIIPSGIHLKNAIARYEKDRKDPRFVFKREAVQKVLDFVSQLKHFMGKHAGKPFVLEPWELFIVANIYGFYWKETGLRRFQNAYIEVARKNGKTALVSALVLYHLNGDGEEGAECLLCANSLDQAKIDLNMVTGFVQGLDPDEQTYKKRFKDVSVEVTNSFVRVLAADSSRMDGYNCSCGIIDEYHSAPDTSVRDVIRSSQGMRENPVLFTITTAGFDKSLPCWDLRLVATEIISGAKFDESFFSVVYSLDEGDDWTDPKVWVKSNPNLGVTVQKSFLEREVLQAKNSPADEVGVKTKNLNIWCDSNTTWIPDDYIIKAQMDIPEEFYTNREEPTFCGVDLASNVDMTACSYLYVSGETYYFRTDFYIPEDTFNQNTAIDKTLYKEWAYQKYLKKTSGNVTDYEYITKDLLKMNAQNEIYAIFYDKWNSNQWAISTTELGLNPQPFSQTIGNFNNATREIERLILSGKVFMDSNPIIRYCFRNVSLKQDFNNNVKPVKLSEKRKIDGVISMIMALACYLEYRENYRGIAIY